MNIDLEKENVLHPCSKWLQIHGKSVSLRIVSVLRLLLLPALGVALLQALSAYAQSFDNTIAYVQRWYLDYNWYFGWNYLILLLPYLFLYFLPKFKITSNILNVFVFLFGMSEHFAVLFRSEIIFPWDFGNISLVTNVMGTYKYEITAEILLACCLLILMIFLSLVGKDPDLRIWISGILCLATVIGCGCYYSFFLSDKYALQDAGATFFYTQVNNNLANGVLLTFCYNMQFLHFSAPDRYSVDKAEDILADYTSDSTSVVPGQVQPDVILVMSEANCDLRTTADVQTSEEVTPFCDSLTGDNVIKKTLISSVYGGNTANAEFEFLMGMSTLFFPSGTYPFKQYIRQEEVSLASILRDDGYETIAVHPFDKTGWNRDKVLPLIGFDSFITKEAFTDAQTYRDYVSDQAAYEYIINEYEEFKADHPDTPLFEYLITIQNHGGYDGDYELPYDITTDTLTTYPLADQYLSLLRLSDDALKELITYFEDIETPTVIIIYGDHQPNLSSDYSLYLDHFADQDDPLSALNHYETELVIWANYDISDSELANIEQDYISQNYMTPYLSDIIGFNRTPFLQYVYELRSKLPVITANYLVDADGNLYTVKSDALPADIKEELEQYEIVQYYQLYDSN